MGHEEGRLTQRQLQPGTQSPGDDRAAYDGQCGDRDRNRGGVRTQYDCELGTRGQFAESVINALAQATTVTWDRTLAVPLSVRDPNALTTSWSYDAFGRRASELRPDQTSTAWARANCSSGCDPRSKYRLTRSEKDIAGTVYSTASAEFDRFDRAFSTASDLPGGGDSISMVDFDERGRVSAVQLPFAQGGLRSGSWRYVYDELGRGTRSELQGPSGSIDRAFTYAYDGLRTTATDPFGHPTTQVTSAWGDPLRITDALGRDTNYEYNAAGLLTRVIDPTGTLVTSVTYNVRGVVTSRADVDMGSWTFDADALGEVLRIRDAKTAAPSWTTIVAYDALSRMTSRQDVAEGVTSTFIYGKTAASHNIGRLQSVAASDGSYSEAYTYDSVGRLSRRRIVADATYDYDYAYNNLGLLQTLQYPVSTPRRGLRAKRLPDAHVAGAAPAAEIWRLTTMDAAGRVLDETLDRSSRLSRLRSTDQATEWPHVRHRRQQLDPDLPTRGTGTAISSPHPQPGLKSSFPRRARPLLARRNGVKNLKRLPGRRKHRVDMKRASEPSRTPTTRRRSMRPVAGANTYGYDPNGNMQTRNGVATSWYSHNLPNTIAQANGNSSQFSYGRTAIDGSRSRAMQGWSRRSTWAGCSRRSRSPASTYRHKIEALTARPRSTWRRWQPGCRDVLRNSRPPWQHRQGQTLRDQSSRRVSAFGRRRGSNWQGTPSLIRGRRWHDGRRLHFRGVARQPGPRAHERAGLRPDDCTLHVRGSRRSGAIRPAKAESLLVRLEQPVALCRSERIQPGRLVLRQLPE